MKKIISIILLIFFSQNLWAIPEEYVEYATKYAQSEGVNPNFVIAVMAAESAFDPNAVSIAGAQGLMQLMPETADRYGVQDPFDPEENIRGGVKYLRHLLGQFGNKRRLVIAAYNAGPGAVMKYGGIPPYAETQTYVRRVMSYFHQLNNSGTIAGTTDSSPHHRRHHSSEDYMRRLCRLNDFGPSYQVEIVSDETGAPVETSRGQGSDDILGILKQRLGCR